MSIYQRLERLPYRTLVDILTSDERFVSQARGFLTEFDHDYSDEEPLGVVQWTLLNLCMHGNLTALDEMGKPTNLSADLYVKEGPILLASGKPQQHFELVKRIEFSYFERKDLAKCFRGIDLKLPQALSATKVPQTDKTEQEPSTLTRAQEIIELRDAAVHEAIQMKLDGVDKIQVSKICQRLIDNDRKFSDGRVLRKRWRKSESIRAYLKGPHSPLAASRYINAKKSVRAFNS